uniref:Uncharacterized protein n=1 Tax=Rhizophora mucronata TaxID=61149 RepID=A0A2P2MW66_RHIMU
MLLLNSLLSRFNTIKFFHDLKSEIDRLFNNYSPKRIYEYANIII